MFSSDLLTLTVKITQFIDESSMELFGVQIQDSPPYLSWVVGVLPGGFLT